MGAEGFNTAEPAYDSHTISESDRMLQYRLLRTLGIAPGTPTAWASALSVVQVQVNKRPWRVVTIWRAWRAGRVTLAEAIRGLWLFWMQTVAQITSREAAYQIRDICLGVLAVLVALVGCVVLAGIGVVIALARSVRGVNWSFLWGVIVGVSVTSAAMLVLGWLAVTARADANAWEILGR